MESFRVGERGIYSHWPDIVLITLAALVLNGGRDASFSILLNPHRPKKFGELAEVEHFLVSSL